MNEWIILNLLVFILVRKFFEDVVNKVGYINGIFDLVWGNGINIVDMVLLDYISDKLFFDVNFELGKKNFLYLIDKDGE